MCLEISFYCTQKFRKDGLLPVEITKDEQQRVGEDENGKYFVAYKLLIRDGNFSPWQKKLYELGRNCSDRLSNNLTYHEDREGNIYNGIHLFTDLARARKIQTYFGGAAKIVECICYLKDVVAFGILNEVVMTEITIKSLTGI